MPAFIDRTAHRYGRLTVVSCVGKRKGRYYWECRCDCGKETVVAGDGLGRGITKSCGCLKRELNAAKRLTHGHARGRIRTPEYRTWCMMKQRCCDIQNKKHQHYGGRGIKVCDRWLESFENFLADVGPRPAGSSLDRIDNNGDYCPENCRWATAKQQARNTSRNRLITWNGVTKALAEWAEEVGIPYGSLKTRICKLGWPVERALTEPVIAGARAKECTFKGKSQTLKEWARETGIPYGSLKARIRKYGWPIERALTEPVQGKSKVA